MTGENLKSLFMLYAKPVAAISRILDTGTLWFAIVAALIVSVSVHLPQPASYSNVDGQRQVLELQRLQPNADAGEPDDAEDAVAAARNPGYARPSFSVILLIAAWQWVGLGGGSFAQLGAVAVVFLPLLIAIRAVSGYGSFGVLMRSEYVPLLMCSMFAWTASYLPIAALEWTVNFLDPRMVLVANLCFLTLTALSLRTLTGLGLAASVALSLLAAVGAIAGLTVYSFLGAMRYYLLSPFFLYYAYYLFFSDVRALGEGLRSRQHLRQQLEISANNPRDADAQYQLGLIYQKRRQYSEAIARFERAIAVDPTEADAHLQLGRIALEQGRYDPAIPHLETAAKLDDKAAASEVWRDLGAAYLGGGQTQQAVAALQKYADRRPYDPEGLYHLGKALATLGKTAEAREKFNECIEAVNTAPGHRRAQVRKWASQAQSALRGLK